MKLANGRNGRNGTMSTRRRARARLNPYHDISNRRLKPSEQYARASSIGHPKNKFCARAHERVRMLPAKNTRERAHTRAHQQQKRAADG